jgi:hypothetical protein
MRQSHQKGNFPMPIYGYQRAVVDAEFGLLELREISLDFNPADLRRLATFMEYFANQIESRTWRSSHAHLTTFDREWNRDHPGIDVIIANPDPEPPARAKWMVRVICHQAGIAGFRAIVNDELSLARTGGRRTMVGRDKLIEKPQLPGTPRRAERCDCPACDSHYGRWSSR